MKTRRKILISTLILGSIVVVGLTVRNIYVPDPPDVVENPSITNEEVKKDSTEVAALKNNIEAFKQKELQNLAEKYLYYSNESETSNIDTKEYTDEELMKLKENYEKENGVEGTPADAIALQNKQNHEKEVKELELYLDDKLAQPILDNKEPIDMPDGALKQAIIDTLKLDVDELYAKHLYHLTTLDLSNLDITSLEGLEYAINLEKLDLSNAKIEHSKVLKPLGMLRKLKELNLLGVFKYMEVGGLNYLTESVETVSIEDYWNTEGFDFETLPYAIDLEETASLEVTPESFFDFEDGVIYGFKNKVDQTLVIPAKIEGIEVLEIAQDAFKSKGIKTLKLPDSNIYLGSSSFLDNEITEVEVSEKIENINGAIDFEVNVTQTGGI